MPFKVFIYNWELLIHNNRPIIIGFGYNIDNIKLSIVVDDFPLHKYSQSVNKNYDSDPFNRETPQKLSKYLLRKYLEGKKQVYKIKFSNYQSYENYHPNLCNMDIVSTFLVECQLETVGWIQIEGDKIKNQRHFTTFEHEYITSYKNIKSIDINKYPEPSIISFDIECMSHDFQSFPNRYMYEDFISTISIVYKDKDVQKNIALCVKFEKDTEIINHENLSDIDPRFISFVDIEKFKKHFNNANNNNNNNNCMDDNNNKNISRNKDFNKYQKYMSILKNNNSLKSSNRNRYNNFRNLIYNSSSLETQTKIDIENRKKENEERKNKYENYEEIEEFIKRMDRKKEENNTKENTFNEEYEIIFVETEYELLCEFFNQIRIHDPDLIIGYNTFGFDYMYMMQRIGMYLVSNESSTCFSASRIVNKKTEFNELWNDEFEIYIPGRLAIDIYKYAKSLNLPSSSLNYVSEKLLKKRKIDLPYKDMFYLIHENTEEALKKVAVYCIMDSILTLEIFKVSHQWIQLIEVAKISRIRIDEVDKSGQSKKLTNLLYKFCYDNDIFIDKNSTKTSDYQGATVINPEPGVYNYCTMLDFTSLYPSVIITHNICYTTIINKKDIKKYTQDSYHTIDIGNNKVYYFTKNHEGILPRLMKVLLTERVRYKNLMKNAQGSDYIIYDKKQYALKIQANSIYGCLGSKLLEYLSFLPGAECTTGMGRNYLNKAIDILHEKTNFRVIYGDTDSCLIEYKNCKNNSNDIDKYGDNDSNNKNKKDKFIKDSIDAAEMVTNLLPEGMHLKYENTFSRMIIISKKKYVGLLANNSELYIKGIDIIKKNTCIFIRDYYKIFIYMILYDYPKNYIKEKVLKMTSDLKSGNVPLSDMVMKLSVGRKYIDKNNKVLLFVNNHKKYQLNYKYGDKVDYFVFDTTTFTFNSNNNYIGNKMMSMDLYNKICEEHAHDQTIIKPKVDYNYYYKNLIRTGYIKKYKKFKIIYKYVKVQHNI
ncbi:DNA/RNA polymerase [Neocallimastix lanati (nom. inval.)]|nr:DNA/RNA polymerase [Neocallimastix sp. JGI-2020a]